MAREASDGSKTYLKITSYGTGTVNGGNLSAKLQNCRIDGSYVIIENKTTITQIKTLLPSATTSDSKLKTGTIITNGSDKYTVVKLGDVNGDGEIDIIDMALIKRHLIGKQTLKKEFYEAGKLKDRTSALDVIDLALIKRHLIGTSSIML